MLQINVGLLFTHVTVIVKVCATDKSMLPVAAVPEVWWCGGRKVRLEMQTPKKEGAATRQGHTVVVLCPYSHSCSPAYARCGLVHEIGDGWVRCKKGDVIFDTTCLHTRVVLYPWLCREESVVGVGDKPGDGLAGLVHTRANTCCPVRDCDEACVLNGDLVAQACEGGRVVHTNNLNKKDGLHRHVAVYRETGPWTDEHIPLDICSWNAGWCPVVTQLHIH